MLARGDGSTEVALMFFDARAPTWLVPSAMLKIINEFNTQNTKRSHRAVEVAAKTINPKRQLIPMPV
jgi:hypothetical protein